MRRKSIFLLLPILIAFRAAAEVDLTNVESESGVNVEEFFKEQDRSPSTEKRVLKKKILKRKPAPGNMPQYARIPAPNLASAKKYQNVKPKEAGREFHPEIIRGTRLNALVLGDLKAVPGKNIPFTAEVESGKYAGYLFSGQYRFYPETKKIEAKFDEFHDPLSRRSYKIEAVGQDIDGEYGLSGEYENHRKKGFFTALFARLVGGVAKHSTEYSKSALIGYERKPGVDNAIKEATGDVIIDGANRYESEVMKEPVFTRVRGPLAIQILITKKPTLIRE